MGWIRATGGGQAPGGVVECGVTTPRGLVVPSGASDLNPRMLAHPAQRGEGVPLALSSPAFYRSATSFPYRPAYVTLERTERRS